MKEDKNKHILLVEDDPNFGMVLKSYLDVKKFQVTLCDDGKDALKIANSQTFDLFILDIMLPNKDGFTIAKELKEQQIDVPFIFLTARGMREDKIKGFEYGALDYLVKPFDPEILYLKIKALLENRSSRDIDTKVQQSLFDIGSFKLDTLKQALQIKDKSINLTYKESELLRMLIQHRNSILVRSQALTEIWGDDNYFTTKSMDVYVTKLRKHLKTDPSNQIEIQKYTWERF